MKNATKCLHSGYTPGNGEPRVVPIVQSTTYTYDSAEDISEVFDDPTKSLVYSRFGNPTVMAVESKIADLEGGVAAMCTSSGQTASLISILNVCNAGDSFISVAQIYGGTANLFSHTLKKYDIECIVVDCEADAEELAAKIKDNTKAIYAETIGNPQLNVLDIEKFAKLAHEAGVPLIVDNTLATPILCKPIEYGADIVVHSTSKYMDGHAVQVGGVIVDSGNFDWTNGKFPGFTEEDASYHGIKYVESYGNLAYIIKARMQLMRDFGAYPAAHSAFLLNLGLETLELRMERCCANALAVARYLEDRGLEVRYVGLENDRYHSEANRYLQGGSGIVTFKLKGGRNEAMEFMNRLELISREVHFADIRTSVLHPASTSHRQLSEEQLKIADVDDRLIRISVGLENIDDILADIEKGFV